MDRPSPLTAPACRGEPPPPTTATADLLQRLRQRGRRTVGFVGALCLAIALLLTVAGGGGFFSKLAYSLAIGSCCTLIVEGTRVLSAWGVDQVRRWRGQPPSTLGAVAGWSTLVPGLLLAAAIGPATGLWLGDRMTGHRSDSLWQLQSPDSRMTLVLSGLALAVSVLVLSTLERLATARAQAEAARREATESRLRLLQSQLEPHMLFNTLANLRVLIGIDPARAQGMLDHLIAFLRATLDASRHGTHPLAAEFALLRDYLALMAVRMGPRLGVRLDLPAELARLPVPALILQPLVENAIQHGLEPQVAGGHIAVDARREGGVLVLSVRDTGRGLPQAIDGQAAPAGTGFGLEQVRRRLATLHGDRASLRLGPAPDADGGVLATVRLPFADAGDASTPAAR